MTQLNAFKITDFVITLIYKSDLFYYAF